MARKIKLIIVACLVLALVVLAVVCKKDGKSPGQCKAIAESRLAVVSTQTTELTVPGNAGIVKIFASVIDSDALPVDGAIIFAGPASQLNFTHVFHVNPATRQGEFEVTFEHPVCVGEEGATFVMNAFRNDGEDPIASFMTLTVVYCPNFCTE